MNRTTRRRFLQTGTAGAAALALPIRFARAAKKGGVMRMGKGHGGTHDSLDPATHENGFTIAMTHGYNNYLTEVAGDGSLVGQLAESWEASADAATWTFQLRKGVTYHNGREVTAEDVVASINHHRGEDSKSAAKPIVSPVTDIKADGKHTAVFTLSAGNADFPFIVSDYHLPIMPSEGGKADWQSGIGTGAYKIKSFEPGVRIDLEKYADYWDSGRGHFDAIQMITITDPAARTNAIITGGVDAIDRADLKTVHLLKRRKGLTVHSIAGTHHYTFPMRTNVAPFSDNNVRMALKHAINREEMVEKILQGFGVVGNDHPIGPGQRFFAKDLEQRTYDPDKAKYYLKQAGHGLAHGGLERRGRGLRGRRRRRRAVRGDRQGGGHQPEPHARAERRVLVERLEQEAVLCLLLGRSAHRRLDVRDCLRGRGALERRRVGTREVQQDAHRGPCGARRGQAAHDVCGDAADRARRGRHHHPHVRLLRLRHLRQARPAGADGLELGSGRRTLDGTLVVRLIRIRARTAGRGRTIEQEEGATWLEGLRQWRSRALGACGAP